MKQLCVRVVYLFVCVCVRLTKSTKIRCTQYPVKSSLIKKTKRNCYVKQKRDKVDLKKMIIKKKEMKTIERQWNTQKERYCRQNTYTHTGIFARKRFNFHSRTYKADIYVRRKREGEKKEKRKDGQ